MEFKKTIQTLGKKAGVGLTEKEKEELHKKKVRDLQRKAELEEARLARQSKNNEYRARITKARKEFNENKPESGFSKIKSALNKMKDSAEADKSNRKEKPKMDINDILGMNNPAPSDDIFGFSEPKKVKKKKLKNRKEPSWDDIIGGDW